MRRPAHGLVICLLLLLPLAVGTAVAQDSADCRGCHERQLTLMDRTYHAGLEEGCFSCHQDAEVHLKGRMEGEETPGPSLANLSAEDCQRRLPVLPRDPAQPDLGRQRPRPPRPHVHRLPLGPQLRVQEEPAQDRVGARDLLQVPPRRPGAGHADVAPPGPRGLMDCASCHNPHDGSTPKMIKADWVNELCLQCHTEKRGPFLWEHAPVRENCLNCHNPHGSNHDKLLVAKQPYLCQRCHLNTRHPGSLYDGTVAPATRPTARRTGRSSTRARTVTRTSTAATRRPDPISDDKEGTMKRIFVILALAALALPAAAQEAPRTSTWAAINLGLWQRDTPSSSKFLEYRDIPQGAALNFFQFKGRKGDFNYDVFGYGVTQKDQKYYGVFQGNTWKFEGWYVGIPHSFGNGGRSILDATSATEWRMPRHAPGGDPDPGRGAPRPQLRHRAAHRAADARRAARQHRPPPAAQPDQPRLLVLPRRQRLRRGGDLHARAAHREPLRQRHRVRLQQRDRDPRAPEVHHPGLRGERDLPRRVGQRLRRLQPERLLEQVRHLRAGTTRSAGPTPRRAMPTSGPTPRRRVRRRGSMSLAPSNKAWNVKAGTTLKFGRSTRLTADAQIGQWTQNEQPFIGWTTNTAIPRPAGPAAREPPRRQDRRAGPERLLHQQAHRRPAPERALPALREREQDPPHLLRTATSASTRCGRTSRASRVPYGFKSNLLRHLPDLRPRAHAGPGGRAGSTTRSTGPSGRASTPPRT